MFRIAVLALLDLAFIVILIAYFGEMGKYIWIPIFTIALLTYGVVQAIKDFVK